MTDIGIVGGGLYGSAIAYFLTEFGDEDTSVTVFEKDDLGGISTARSAGILRHHYSNRRHVEIVSRSREIMESLEDHVGHDGGFTQNGFLVGAGPEEADALRDIVAVQQDLGLDVELLDPQEMDAYLPALDADGFEVGAYESQAGFADPYRVATGFASAASSQGATIHTDTPVVDVERDGGEVTAVRTGEGRHEVDVLVNAAGPFGAEVAAMVDVDVPLSWYEVKVAVLTADTPYDADLPTFSDVDDAIYTKPEHGGDFIVGGFNDPPMDAPDAGFETMHDDDYETLVEWFDRRMPGYADAKVVDSWSGVITPSPDWHQIIGRPAGLENFYNAVAGSGHGFKEAAGFAESIAQDVLGRTPRFDLSPYRLERFAEGDELESRYSSASWLA
ncbi:FAD-dependent oxidoreductase [Haloarculaceae archaeon H-GB2-1]|nr:FAD-dependent oxidoreductase [Haloarculaceae archaeon H-GB1-1]MEA5406673.1 FAD-dependent oxidoreductase [Haloarculaceae archaeon H-GB2-1]